MTFVRIQQDEDSRIMNSAQPAKRFKRLIDEPGADFFRQVLKRELGAAPSTPELCERVPPPPFRLGFFESVHQNVERVVARAWRCVREDGQLRARHLIDVGHLCVRRQVQYIQLRHQFIAFRDGEPDTDAGSGTHAIIRYHADSLVLRYIHDSQLFGLTGWDRDSTLGRPKCQYVLCKGWCCSRTRAHCLSSWAELKGWCMKFHLPPFYSV